ncbi:response regulator [Pseudanabaena sp. PCC 6802]|uniref:response regulator n=1 Tax=Pseudanabaena sp. PCC 6802 TaxID=118173 RepID=UPI00034A9B0B|nr:response regulator [Pseudanabaena sp. PCC 6802]
MPEVNSLPTSEAALSPIDLAEAQLQQELRSMFDVDTQTYLHDYMSLAQQLKAPSWTADIQELYRCIHTIKGGAVTVGADGILYVATVLEDLLSDLRYLQIAPPLEDGQLSQVLLEAGELLTGSLQVQAVGEQALAVVQPSVDRIATLRQIVQQVYLPDSNERTQLFHEFAEQGFDLVVLNLEMAVEQLGDRGKVPNATLKIAKQTLQQLLQIGKDLEFEPGWTKLLRRSQSLLSHPENDFWQAKWPPYLRLLKDCARKGGKLSASVAQKLGVSAPSAPTPVTEVTAQPDVIPSSSDRDQPSDFAIASPIPSRALEPAAIPTSTSTVNPDVSAADVLDWSQPTKQQDKAAELAAKAQIPVPLERLDRSAQYLVSTLLSTRSSQGSYQALELQLVKLVALAQDSAEYITRLRQLQDDYALLTDTEPGKIGESTPTLERYRQGYSIVNRLLETSLRLSELGAEVTASARQTSDNLQQLERNVLNLQQTVEESRLIPFRILGLRARGILRDLVTRFGKPAQLVIEGEQIELDAGTSQTLEPILLHLIRNAYDHGLESASDRANAGKPSQGTITVALKRQGNSYLLDVKDDGIGMDPAKIRAIAQSKRLPLTRTDTPADILAVICQSGFSSQSTVSDISGRGVGMDVVATQITRLGGRLSLNTTLGAGTTFNMQIPVPQLLVRCVLVRAGDRTFAIPTDEIITTTLWGNLSTAPTLDRQLAYGWQVELEGVTMPALDLLEYWQEGVVAHAPTATSICLRVRSSAIAAGTSQRDAWLVADDLLGQDDILISPLPHPLVAPVGMMGVSLQSNGSLIPVLEPNLLAEYLLSNTAKESAIAAPASTAAIASPQVPVEQKAPSTAPLTQTILVVDDAALMRRRMEASLTAYGFTVQTCNDGLDAWNWLQNHNYPAIVITDIEMPGMDGFTLIDRCRRNDMNFPILVISSRLSEEWSNEAKRLGATDYLTKGFATSELIDKVNAYLKG